MNHQRPYEIDTDNIREAGQPNMLKDLLRGLIADTRGALEGRAMRRQARDAKEKGIADEAYRQRMASAQEKQIAIAQQRADLEGTKYEDDQKAAAAKAKLDEEKRNLEKQAKEDYANAFEAYHEAYKTWLNDQSPENENRLRSATQNFQYYSSLIDVNSDYAGKTLEDLETQAKEQKQAENEANLDTDTDAFNEAYSTFNSMTPADEGYADAHTKHLRAAQALNRTQEALGINDPLIDNILKNPENMGKVKKLSALEDMQAEVTGKFWEAYQEFTTNPDATLQNVEQAGAEVINLLSQLGEPVSTYTSMLENLRQQNTERIKAKREAQDAKNERLDTTNIPGIITDIQNDSNLDDTEKSTIIEGLETGLLFQTRDDLKKYLTSLHTNKARAKYTGTDASKAINKVEKYEATGPNRRLINAVVANQQKDKRQFNIDYLDDVFEGEEFPELSENQKDAAALFFLQQDKAPGGDLVTRFMQATTFLQNGLANLYEEYNRVTKDGQQVKHKLGRLEKVREGVYRHIAGDITDPDVAAFDAKVGYLLTTYIRMVSGAQVTTYEESNFKKMLVSAGNTIELNDAIFKALDDEIRAQLQGYFSRRVGNEWGETVGDKVYHDAHNIAESVAAKTDSRIDGGAPSEPTKTEPMQWKDATDETKLKSTIDGLKGIDSNTGDAFEKMSRDELKKFMIEVGATEEEAERLLDEAEAAIAAEGTE